MERSGDLGGDRGRNGFVSELERAGESSTLDGPMGGLGGGESPDRSRRYAAVAGQNPGGASRATREPVRAPVSGRTDGSPAHPVL